jgi:type IV secretory pathway TraG/TraD family ATPase VirD4
MTPTKFLIGQIIVVFAIVIAGVWFATEWCAAKLGSQAQLGALSFELIGIPFYYPWRLFEWWYSYDAYRPNCAVVFGTTGKSTVPPTAIQRRLPSWFRSCSTPSLKATAASPRPARTG